MSRFVTEITSYPDIDLQSYFDTYQSSVAPEDFQC